ncbi:MAG: hypothetical protein ACI856_002273 [Kiritimatiellia bacterium]|jgi:hypothetical protein
MISTKHTSAVLAVLLAGGLWTSGAEELLPGLVATYSDDTRSVSEVVLLPELGLAAEESPHPAITPFFTAVYKGILLVTQKGNYQFHHTGSLLIDSKPAEGEVELGSGEHVLLLTVKRTRGMFRSGLSWQSVHFIKEPVPPTVLRHKKGDAPPSSVLAGKQSSPPTRIAESIKNQKCASCHDANFLATMHHKFKPEALVSVMGHSGPKKWFAKPTGPVLEDRREIEQLAKDLQKLPFPMREQGTSVADLKKAVTMINNKDGFACITCHGIKHHRAEAESEGPNLSLISQRVSYDWFVRWMTNPGRLKPGVAMPPFFASQTEQERQRNIDHLWAYLQQGQKMDLPDELKMNPKAFVLKPTNKPMVQRVYIDLPDGRQLFRAICVGLPSGLSYCFDADTCQLVYAWTGGFLDMAPHWKNKSGSPSRAVGKSFFLSSVKEGLHVGDHKPVFRGYELVSGVPRFEFSFGKTEITLLIDAPSSQQLRQTYTIGKRSEAIQVVGPSAESTLSMTSSTGAWQGNRLTIADASEVKLTLTLKKGE